MNENPPGHPEPGVETLPSWLHALVGALPEVRSDQISRFVPPPDGSGRPSAVLMLFGEGERGPDVLLLERAATLRSHAGQPAFPGGATDPGDDGPVGTALREANEEVGLDPGSVRVIGELPPVLIPVSGFIVTGVLGWWERPHPVGPVDPGEVATVARVPIADLADPDNRFRVSHPSGVIGPGFGVSDMFVWGFTAGLISFVLDLGGWARPWNRSRMRDLPADALALARQTRPPDAVR
ncbi:NUDIX hydrolase [Cryptosporangium phraense]|uniref:CoA pyrophosphatase n=1 Tax=Cryptosporangium phraense TaxID=2593070 RepID=A0A545AR48_9ACTN|nr:CoA pyrophosphatase [Cryptosporangium phraense]TQS43804.1 CoA pyrophosphatase [Cryptosporangium phraense]